MTIDKTFLDALQNGHAEVAREMFKASIADKTFAALDDLRSEVAASFMPTASASDVGSEQEQTVDIEITQADEVPEVPASDE